MVSKFSPAAEIVSGVWGTPGNFNGFRVLAALLHGIVVCVSQIVALNRGRHLYSAGRPSHWALATFLVNCLITSAKENMFSSLSACLLATLRKNFQTDLHEIFMEGKQWANEQMTTFW